MKVDEQVFQLRQSGKGLHDWEEATDQDVVWGRGSSTVTDDRKVVRE